MDVLNTVLMKTPIYMRSLIMKDKEKKNDFYSSLFVLSVSLILYSFFITIIHLSLWLRVLPYPYIMGLLLKNDIIHKSIVRAL